MEIYVIYLPAGKQGLVTVHFINLRNFSNQKVHCRKTQILIKTCFTANLSKTPIPFLLLSQSLSLQPF